MTLYCLTCRCTALRTAARSHFLLISNMPQTSHYTCLLDNIRYSPCDMKVVLCLYNNPLTFCLATQFLNVETMGEISGWECYKVTIPRQQSTSIVLCPRPCPLTRKRGWWSLSNCPGCAESAVLIFEWANEIVQCHTSFHASQWNSAMS